MFVPASFSLCKVNLPSRVNYPRFTSHFVKHSSSNATLLKFHSFPHTYIHSLKPQTSLTCFLPTNSLQRPQIVNVDMQQVKSFNTSAQLRPQNSFHSKFQNLNSILVKRKYSTELQQKKSSKKKLVLGVLVLVLIIGGIAIVLYLQGTNYPEFENLFSDPETTRITSNKISAIIAQEIFQTISNDTEKYSVILPNIDRGGIDYKTIESSFTLAKFGNVLFPFQSQSRCLIGQRIRITTDGTNGKFNGLIKLRGVMSSDANNNLVVAVKDFNVILEPNEITDDSQKIQQYVFQNKYEDDLNGKLLHRRDIKNLEENPVIYIQFEKVA